MSSRPQPALPGASHGQRGSCTAGPPHLAPLWTPAATLQAFGVGREVHSEYSYVDVRHQTHLTHTLCIKQYIRTYILYVHTCTNGCTYTYTHTHMHTYTHTHTLPHMNLRADTNGYISYIITYIDKPKTFIMRQHWPLAA